MASSMQIKEESPECSARQEASFASTSGKMAEEECLAKQNYRYFKEKMTFEDEDGVRKLAVVNVTRIWQEHQKSEVQYEVTLEEASGYKFATWVDFSAFLEAPTCLRKFYSEDHPIHYEIDAITGIKKENGDTFVRVRWGGRWTEKQTWEKVHDLPDLTTEMYEYSQKVEAMKNAKDRQLGRAIAARLDANAKSNKNLKRLEAKVQHLADHKEKLELVLAEARKHK